MISSISFYKILSLIPLLYLLSSFFIKHPLYMFLLFILLYILLILFRTFFCKVCILIEHLSSASDLNLISTTVWHFYSKFRPQFQIWQHWRSLADPKRSESSLHLVASCRCRWRSCCNWCYCEWPRKRNQCRHMEADQGQGVADHWGHQVVEASQQQQQLAQHSAQHIGHPDYSGRAVGYYCGLDQRAGLGHGVHHHEHLN